MRKESEKREVKENLHKKAINDQLMMPNARRGESSALLWLFHHELIIIEGQVI